MQKTGHKEPFLSWKFQKNSPKCNYYTNCPFFFIIIENTSKERFHSEITAYGISVKKGTIQ